ncbi:MAG: hypothetical protein KTR30_05180 [Saprospiraceae bacterium]|nr:hypothetical protein [Saprospiraceae bacterium]
MHTQDNNFGPFATKELKQEEIIIIKAGGESDSNPLFVDPVQQGENPLYGG